MKKFILLFLLFLVGCATAPKPAPMPKSTNYCAPGETKDCREWTAGEKAGAGSRGHSEEPKEKIMLYKEPEIIFKDEHTPSACRSPFR